MYDEFLMGVICGFLIGIFVFLLADLLSRINKEDKKETIQKTIKTPVIHEEHLHPVTVNVAVEVPREEFATFSSHEYKKRVITGKLKLKLIDKLWEFVKFEEEYDPRWFIYRYHAKLMVLLPVRQALKVEVEKETF